MTNLYDKHKYRLDDAEKSAIWREISAAQTARHRRRLPRLKPVPAWATAAVAVCGLAVVVLVSRDALQKTGRVGGGRAPFEVAVLPESRTAPDPGTKGQPTIEEVMGQGDGRRKSGAATPQRAVQGPPPAATRRESAADAAVVATDAERDAATPERRSPAQAWVPPNDQAYDTVYFRHYGVNPFVVTAEDPQSTFAVDVDNASYTVMRRYLRDGHLPPPEAVRVEEYVNYFAQGYPAVDEGDFAVRADGAPSPFGSGYHLLRIGVQSRSIAPERRRPANLVFVIDVSGSMNRENRLELVKRALSVLLDELEEGDRVGIVVYGSAGRVVLEPTAIEQRERLEQAIASLEPAGSTNAEEGLRLAYAMARAVYQPGAINRLILCSDGVANQGSTGAASILARVREESDRGIGLSTIGFGMGNYNDVLMEQLADHGDGGYYYVDDLREAERVLRENLTGTLQTVGKDVKIQVAFDPAQVLRYRLLGYENRDVADDAFRDDAVDAGEVGAGHEVTALYEIKLSDAAAAAVGRRGAAPRLATVRLRYQVPEFAPQAGVVKEIAQAVTTAHLVPRFADAAIHFQLAAAVAEYAEILRGSYWARGNSVDDLVPLVDRVAAALEDDEAVREFRQLVSRAADLQADAGRPQRD